ncbi:uncharacterized protein [Chelonus insularis]|uniref:uncharacterized protein n=1 Tax=Chelonus insularis TaxID=460826 RepID=UPI00158C01CA|nr:uncharacterized protein LOC118063762 [Chelonus insularis]
MISNILFIYLTFSVIFVGLKALPIAEDRIWSTFLDINELSVDGFDDVRLNLVKGNNPFQDDEMMLEIVKLISGERSSVTIKRSKILADKSTAVWYGQNTYTGFGDISYQKSTIDQVPEGFPDFAMFQNYQEKVALVAFGNKTHWTWEGFIGDSVIQHVFENLYVLLDVTFPSPASFSEKVKKYNYSTPNQLPMNLNSTRRQIIPEILVALDWKSVENKTARDVIKEMIVYYNAVDMLFSQFASPSIQLNIAGIVIPKDSKSSPYFEKTSCKIEEEYYSNECLSYVPILDHLIRHFRKYNDIFLTKDYDMVMGMTGLPLCDADGVCEHYGTSFASGTCENVDDDLYPPIPGVVRHPHFRGNYFLAAQEIGHILGSEYIYEWAPFSYGGIMSRIESHQDLHQRGLNWSTHAVHGISTHIRERENYTRCMWNLPRVFEKPEGASTTTELITKCGGTPTSASTTVETTTEAVTTSEASTAAPDATTTGNNCGGTPTSASTTVETTTETVTTLEASTAAPDATTTGNNCGGTSTSASTTVETTTEAVTTLEASTAAPDTTKTGNNCGGTPTSASTTVETTTEAFTTLEASTAAPDTTKTGNNCGGTSKIPFTSTEATTIEETTTVAATTNITVTSSTPVDPATEITSTAIPDDVTTSITFTTVSTGDMTTTKPTTLIRDDNLIKKISKTMRKIHSTDPVTVIVVKRNTDGTDDVIVQRPKTLKTIVGDVVHNIYNFIGGLIKKHVDD